MPETNAIQQRAALPPHKYTPKPGVPEAVSTAASLMGKRAKGVQKTISAAERLARGERARHCTAVREARKKAPVLTSQI